MDEGSVAGSAVRPGAGATATAARTARPGHPVPEEWRGQLNSQATWLYRTMKATELASLDAAEITQAAVRSRSLDGTRDVASVPDLRFTEMDSAFIGDAGRIEVTLTVASHKRRELALEAIIGRFADMDGVIRASWRLNPQAS